MNDFVQKVKRLAVRARIQPIRVFCFHQVSDEFEPNTMKECDWIQTELFKRAVLSLKNDTRFISLQEAYFHVINDKIRVKQFAVLTADDGWASLLNILPWLSEESIPLTLFLNPGYFDGNHFREKETERYLLDCDIIRISESYSNVFFGVHGWSHIDVSKQSEVEFRKNVEQSVDALRDYKTFVPFFAYPWGKRSRMNDRLLKEYNLVPVLMDGMMNYNDSSAIHRELLH